MGERFLKGWELGAVVLLMLALVTSWIIHIKESIPESGRPWLYFILSLVSFFFYGIHETSVFGSIKETYLLPMPD